MATGACGIDCGTCRLNAFGFCSTCGPGTSLEGLKKLETQVRILGSPCPILRCAVENKVEYCLRDCLRFPCERFRSGPYPFSEGFLKMQERRRMEPPPGRSPVSQPIQVPVRYWEELAASDLGEICRKAIAEKRPPSGILLSFLSDTFWVDIEERRLKAPGLSGWDQVDDPLLELILLVYLLNAKDEPLAQEMITVQQLKDAHFFQGPHDLHTKPLIDRFGRDLKGFRNAAAALGGVAIDAGDAGFRIQALPRVPLYYILWEGDDEFEPRLSVLFDRSIEKQLNADGIWGLVQLVSGALIKA